MLMVNSCCHDGHKWAITLSNFIYDQYGCKDYHGLTCTRNISFAVIFETIFYSLLNNLKQFPKTNKQTGIIKYRYVKNSPCHKTSMSINF